jgi:hypothetical protein
LDPVYGPGLLIAATSKPALPADLITDTEYEHTRRDFVHYRYGDDLRMLSEAVPVEVQSSARMGGNHPVTTYQLIKPES